MQCLIAILIEYNDRDIMNNHFMYECGDLRHPYERAFIRQALKLDTCRRADPALPSSTRPLRPQMRI